MACALMHDICHDICKVLAHTERNPR